MAVIAKYKFNSTLYADLVPEFNAEFTNYVVTDEATETDSEGNVIKTRIIEHDTLLPTLMRFGRIKIEDETATDNRTDSLLEVLDMNTSELTSCYSMFRYNTNLTSISCEWNTSNVTSMSSMFHNCNNLTSLDVSNFDTNEVITMSSMFCMCKSLTSLDVSNFDTNNVTNMYSMFRECNKLTLLDVSNFNTKNVTNMYCLFDNCKSLTSIDVSNFDTSNVTNMYGMFAECKSLTSLDVSNFDTSNVTTMFWMFGGCKNLTSLDVSNFDTSNVTTMEKMFLNCNNLTSLDVSNFNISKVTNMDDIFSNTPLLKDVGMLYCSQSTINTISSNISTPSTNVWVEGSMINDLTSYDNVTYKAYYWEKEVLLNSPLLEGDKIVKKDGKLYHYHKMGMIVLDGSEDENWVGYGIYSDVIGFYLPLKLENKNNYIYISDISIKQASYDIVEGGIVSSNEELFTVTIKNVKIIINKSRLSTTDVNGLKQWLSENPTTVVYELINPYYELISDTSEDLSLSLISEDNIISNNSLIPTNMNVKNNGMSTVAMQSSTKYTVAFDKDTDSSVTIDLCGSTIDTTDNVVEITTPSELANDEITFIGDCEVSNVRILEGSVSGDAIPRESFEGLKNSFEDGYIPNNLITDMEYTLCNVPTNIIVGESAYPSFYIEGNNRIRTNLIPVKPNTTYTTYTQLFELTVHHYDIDNLATVPASWIGSNLYSFTTSSDTTGVVVYARGGNDNPSLENRIGEFNPILLEGDWTHLTEEDFNNLGKYKVEYKVTGKNKLDLLGDVNMTLSTIEGDTIIVNANDKNYYASIINESHSKLKADTDYTLSLIYSSYIQQGERRPFIQFQFFLDDIVVQDSRLNIDGLEQPQNYSFRTPKYYDRVRFVITNAYYTNNTFTIKGLQIEEGTVATEYEPYKSYTKTFYLNSPLLEGDTIEDVNGVATHVKRYDKVTEKSILDYREKHSSTSFTPLFKLSTGKYVNSDYNVSNKLINIGNTALKLTGYNQFYVTDDNHLWVSYNGTQSQFLDFIRECDIVCKLASPQYEPISTESILCDSYVNGHLDVDSNIPIEKIQFGDWYKGLKYLLPSTDYTIQFQSDNKGLADDIRLGHWGIVLASNIVVSKGINVIKVTTPNELVINMLYMRGIGFNASNIQVVATDRDNIGYFKGIQSSFEDKIIRNKNLFNKNDVVLNYGFGSDGSIINPSSIEHSTEYIECKPNTSYICNFGTGIHYFDENKTWISYQNHGTSSPSNAKYLVKCIGRTVDLNTVQIEEGIESTTYEEYNIYNGKYEVKVTLEDENGVISNEFIYLNSPLLKGDKIEMYNGKLCHYHKMSKVVLGDSNSLTIGASGYNSRTTTCKRYYISQIDNNWFDAPKCYPSKLTDGMLTAIYCDKIPTISSSITVGETEYNGLGISLYSYKDYNNPTYQQFRFVVPSSIGETVEDFKQWLLANPITIVYELAEPYYEDITPIQNEFIIASIGESSFTIDSGAIPTDGEITYSVNVKLLNDLEESINNNTSSTDTDLSTILDDIINE